MTKQRLVWKLYGTYLVVILLCTLAVGGNAILRVEPFYTQSKARELEQKARLIEEELLEAIARPRVADLRRPTASEAAELVASVEPLLTKLGQASGTRLTVILSDGRVIGDSQNVPGEMEPHADRPEFQQALRGEIGHQTRWSSTLRVKMLYVGVPLRQGQTIVGVVRAALPLTEIDQTLTSLTHGIFIGALLVAALASLLALVISYRISRPLRDIRLAAERFSEGDFSHKLATEQTTAEISGLAISLNSMAEQLDLRIRTVTRQQRELASVLSSMSEGVLAVDVSGRVISINQAAARMYDLGEASPVRGRLLAEAIRDPALQDFVRGVWAMRQESEAELTLNAGPAMKHLAVHGSPLRDADDREIGVLVMLRDVTHLRMLEGVRRDFVANVSHELKTPITSIQGFVETLRDGAMDDKENAARFLEIIARQADRLSAIIDDLLSLSRIEQDGQKGRIETSAANLREVIQAAATLCQAKAAERQVRLEIECPSPMRVRINPQLVEQALSNLLDNAIKYSEPEGCVTVRAGCRGRDLTVEVIDRGCGIPQEHQGRIFERFYRVDKARSRKLGGTGLGLAIVKHIAQAHGGRVTVASQPGQGSTFTLHFPDACLAE